MSIKNRTNNQGNTDRIKIELKELLEELGVQQQEIDSLLALRSVDDLMVLIKEYGHLYEGTIVGQALDSLKKKHPEITGNSSQKPKEKKGCIEGSEQGDKKDNNDDKKTNNGGKNPDNAGKNPNNGGKNPMAGWTRF